MPRLVVKLVGAGRPITRMVEIDGPVDPQQLEHAAELAASAIRSSAPAARTKHTATRLGADARPDEASRGRSDD